MTKEEMKRRKDLILELMKESRYRPMRFRELAQMLGIEKEKRDALREVLEALLEEEKISLSARGRYKISEAETLEGIYTANPKGFGFVAVEGREDIFIPEGEEGQALHGDRVSLRTRSGKRGGRTEGRIVKILEHANTYIVGLYKKNRSFGFLLPDNQKITKDIFIPEEKSMDAKDGMKVRALVYDFGDGKSRKPEAEIVEILGYMKDPGVDILSIIRSFDLPEKFSEELLGAAASIPQQVNAAAYPGRRDYRELLTITIDGEDAKDLDDAISIEYRDGVWRLGVHIADVSEYVKEGSPLDREALERGTSVYLADRVLPMLPPALSNGICSLNAGEDRLALSCIMEIDEKLGPISHEICETIIRVNHRMTYTQVYDILEGGPSDSKALGDMLREMERLALFLRKRRMERGSIDFDLPETRLRLDERGRVVSVGAYERNTAHRIIEEFMLLANETVAQEYYWQELPFLYRVHDKPDPEKIRALSVFIGNFGYRIKAGKGEVHPKEIQKLLRQTEGSDAKMLIDRIALRSMKQARYQSEAGEHFGLAARYYTHFTSPIRRYPDLQIHRIIKENIRKGISQKRLAHYEEILGKVAWQSSLRERRAADAERETLRYKKCEYMQRHVGECFGGVISGVTAYGIYVELENTIEGMIRITELKDDYYRYVEESYALVGEKRGRVYQLGQRMEIEVARADKLTGNIDFLPVYP